MIKKFLTLVLCISLFYCGAAGADSVSVGQNLSAIYDNMVQAFELGEFDDALALFDTTPALASYKDALSYQHYMKARNLFAAEDYESAILLFRTVEAFQDSAWYLAYAQGRKAEEKGEYSDAVNYYIQAANLEQFGVDVMDRLAACNRNVSEAENRQKYEQAVNSFEKAVESGLRSEIVSCLTVFRGLGNYKEAASYAEKCEAWIQTADRVITFSEINTTPDGIRLMWKDNESEKNYRLCYRVQGTCKWNVLEIAGTSADINGLFPGTVYEVSLEDEKLPEKKLTAKIQTGYMSAFDDATLSAAGSRVIGIKRLALQQKTAVELINEYETQLLVPENNQFTASDTEAYALYLSVSIENRNSEDVTYDSWLVLRTASHGVYGIEKTGATLPGGQFNTLLNWDISPLLKQIRDEYGMLPPDTYMVEMVLEDRLFSQVSFVIQ